MSDRMGTFLFIPHEKSDVRSYALSRSGIVGLACVAVGVVAFVLGLGALALVDASGVPGMASENERLESEIATMESQVAVLGRTLEDLLDREEELRLIADLPPVPVEVQAVGVGGPATSALAGASADRELTNRLSGVSTSLDVLLRRSELVASSMEDVRASIASKKEKFEATPSIWPASGFLSSTYSLHRRHPIFHDIRPHYGIDISARRGSPIVATAEGRVLKAGWENGHGNHVVIDHGHGIRTSYSHASRVLVRPGQRVERGDTIGLVGSTGFSVAPHVHYEVHEKGRAVDPLKYIFPDAIAD